MMKIPRRRPSVRPGVRPQLLLPVKMGIAIQEVATIREQHTLDDQENTRRRRFLFYIDLNQSIVDDMQIIDGTFCGTQLSLAINVLPNKHFNKPFQF
ncbi:hypothetical protein SUGI_0407670 [Cryptomeria japonica]|nr:hypothetical protein SUGI_0407670 [Cryptomeria japonica]